MLWVELYPPKRYVGVLTPNDLEGDFIWNKVIADITTSGEIILGSGGLLIQYEWCSPKKGERHSGRMSCNDRDRDCSDAPRSRGMSRMAGRYQKQEARKDSPSQVSEGPWPC